VIESSLRAPCAVCGVSSLEGLFPPAKAGNTGWRPGPGPRIPLCSTHKMDLLRGVVGFPEWCPGCDAYRAADHRHEPARRSAR